MCACTCAGPYLLGLGLVLTGLSKEMLVLTHNMGEAIFFIGGSWILVALLGKQTADYLNKNREVSPLLSCSLALSALSASALIALL